MHLDGQMKADWNLFLLLVIRWVRLLSTQKRLDCIKDSRAVLYMGSAVGCISSVCLVFFAFHKDVA